MVHKRIYYTDSYKSQFKATITERVREEQATAVVLNQTCFYPTSGGQPHDRGHINGMPVLDVTVRESDGAILHWLSKGDIWSDEVTAEIDWPRRFDHMQQHTGQHILSQAFLRVAEAETVSFHLSDKSVTIDLLATAVKPEHIELAEQLANQIIWQNRPIHTRFVSVAEANQLNLRKIPPSREGTLRLVDIENFDLNACGGTHVRATGEVGIIKVVRLERNGNLLRVEFCCGQRALGDYRQKNSIISRLTAVLTTGTTELVEAVNKLQQENKENKRTLKQQQNAIVQLEAAQLMAQSKKKSKINIITRAYNDTDSNPAQLRTLANRLAKEDKTIALLGLAGEKSLLIFCRSADAPSEMNQIIKPALQLLGTASGGGTAEMAQGGGPTATVERLEQALARAERLLLGQL